MGEAPAISDGPACSARETGRVLKTKLLPPPADPLVTHPRDRANVNVAFRKALGLFASVRARSRICPVWKAPLFHRRLTFWSSAS